MELLIKNGTVLDPFLKIFSKQDILIQNGKILHIANNIEKEGIKTIFANNLFVTPGFVDIHMHEEKFLGDDNKFETSIFECMIKMGVTTCIGGNCGEGPIDPILYINKVRELKLPANFNMFLSHEFLRNTIGLTNKYQTASEKQIKLMVNLADELLEQNFVGISFGIRYVPGISNNELVALSKVVKKYNKVVAAHIRDDANNVYSSIIEFLDLAYMIDGIKLQLSHIGSMAGFGQMEKALSLVDEYKSNGFDVSCDCYPYTAFSTKIGETTYDDGWLDRYNTSYDIIEIASGEFKGQRCSEELFIKLRKEHPETITIAHLMNKKDIDLAYKHPNVFVASDGFMYNFNGHPRAAGTFPRVIAKYVKEKSILSLNEAISKMTFLPAEKFGLQKGKLVKGMDADIVIWDFNRIKDNATFENPSLSPDGIEYVILKGNIVVEQNKILHYNIGELTN